MNLLRAPHGVSFVLTVLIAGCATWGESPSGSPVPLAPFPTATAPTPSPPVATPNPELLLVGEIWYWNAGGVRSEFGRLPEATFERLGIVPMTLPDGSPSPRAGFEFDFDRYGRGIAYLTNTDALRLWVSNLDLRGAVNAWTDEDAWLQGPTDYEQVDVRWGPGDRSILIARDRRLLIHSLTDGSNTRFEGECAALGVSLADDIAVLCNGTLPSTAHALFALTPDGSFRRVGPEDWTAIPEVTEWAFSPDSDQILFATQDRGIAILSSDAAIRELPMAYFPSFAPSLNNTRELQWSIDGSQLLIMAVPTLNGACPGTEGYDMELPCWTLLDADSGQVLWTSGPEGPGAGDDASLSPDGMWIVGSYERFPDRFGRVVSVIDGTIVDVYLGVLYKVRWVE